jgi:Protein of unknown function (DUF3551)
MRVLALAIVAIGMIAAAAPVRAQAWDPNYPVCLQVFGPINYNECRYTSLAQCAASASGRAAECIINPFAAHVHDNSVQRRHRHYGHPS